MTGQSDRKWFGLLQGKSNSSSTTPHLPQLPTLRWGPFAIPRSEATQHFAAVGATGSGKTVILRLFIQSEVQRITQGSGSRLLLNNAKNEWGPLIAAMRPRCRVIYSDAFDLRSSAWDMAADVREPRVALEISFTLIPESNESQRFFSDASRNLLYGVILSYQQRGIKWKFADVLRALQSPRLLKRVLLACPYTRYIVRMYFREKKTLASILSTLATKMIPYEHIAAAWETATDSFSVTQWADESWILLLGSSDIASHSMAAINQCIGKRASDELLSRPDSQTRRTTLALDELSDLGLMPGLIPLAKKGRSKGICLLVGFQSIAGLRSTDSYGPEKTADLLGQFGYRFFGRIECPETAKWASELIGDQEVIQTTQSWTKGKETTETTTQQHYATRNTVLPSELMSPPACTPENGLTAWYLNRCHDGVVHSHIDGKQLFGRDLKKPDASVSDFMPRSPQCQLLRPWTKQEEALFAPVFRKDTAAEANAPHVEGLDFSAVDNL